jgi:hypothetical protein
MSLKPTDYSFTYHPCERRIIDIASMREKTQIFADHVIFPFIRSTIHLQVHDTNDGSLNMYPLHSAKLDPTILEVGIISEERAEVLAREQERHLEITVGKQIFRLYENTYNPRQMARRAS